MRSKFGVRRLLAAFLSNLTPRMKSGDKSPHSKFCAWAFAVILLPQSTSIEALYAKAREAEAAKNYKVAAGYYEQILKREPKLYPMRANLGLMLYLAGDYSNAVNEFRKALAGDATLLAAQAFLGLSLIELDKPAEAIPYLESATKAKPQDGTIRFQLARAYFLSNRSRDALLILEDLRKRQPNDVEVLYLLGRVHQRLSVESYEELKRRDPENYRIYQLLGENYEIQGLNSAAIDNYRIALEKNPRAPGLNLKLGDLYVLAGSNDKALANFEKELEMKPGDAGALWRIGSLKAAAGQLEEGKSYFERSIAANPNLAPAHEHYGRAMLAASNIDKAVAELEAAVKLDPAVASAWFNLAKAYEKAGRASDAQRALKTYEQLTGKN